MGQSKTVAIHQPTITSCQLTQQRTVLAILFNLLFKKIYICVFQITRMHLLFTMFNEWLNNNLLGNKVKFIKKKRNIVIQRPVI